LRRALAEMYLTGKSYKLTTLCILFIFAGVYEFASRTHLGGLRLWIFFVPPSRILATFFSLLLDGTLLEHAVYSMMRVGAGLAIGVLLGTPLGLLIGWSRSLDLVIGPIVDLVRTFPKPALFPLLIVISGIGEVSKVILISFGIFFIVCINSIYGGRSIDRVLVASAKVMGATGAQIFTKIVIPYSLPYVSAGIRISLATSLTYLTFAEMLAAERGIGYLVLYSQRNYSYDTMFVGVMAMSLIGGSMVFAYLSLERRFLSWFYAMGRRGGDEMSGGA